MMKKDVGKYVGKTALDIQDVTEDLIDAKDGEMSGYMREKPGFDKVEEELASAIPTHGDRAGIHANVYAGLTSKTGILTKIRAHKLIVAKMYEVLCESEIYYEDAREGDLIRLAKMILDTAHHDNQQDLLAVFDKTLRYRSQYAEKAVATKRKKKEVKAEHKKAAPPTST